MCRPARIAQVREKIVSNELQRRVDKVLELMEQPTLLGPALAEMGNDDHAAWDRGWDAAVRFFRVHLTETKEA